MNGHHDPSQSQLHVLEPTLRPRGMATAKHPRQLRVSRSDQKREASASRVWTPEQNGVEAQTDGQQVMLEKGHEFFQICDTENKGYITRMDMQRLQRGLSLSPQELEKVFDSLDADGNGFLTLEEFTTGFSAFVLTQTHVTSESDEETEIRQEQELLYQSPWEERSSKAEDEDDRQFNMLIENLGANNVVEDQTDIKKLWTQLRSDGPHLLPIFEEFLFRVFGELEEANAEKKEMEFALKKKLVTHDEEIQSLYEEMEQQIKSEKERILIQDSEKFLSRSQELEQHLKTKEQEMEQLLQKQRMLDRECSELYSDKYHTKAENDKLKQANLDLGKELDRASQELLFAQKQLQNLQDDAARLQEEREMEVYRVTEGLQREKATLIKQLDLMREMNKHLRDERDMCLQKSQNSPVQLPVKQRSGSTIGKYIDRKASIKSLPSEEEEEDVFTNAKRKNSDGLNSSALNQRKHLQRIISIEEDPLPQLLLKKCDSPLNNVEEVEEDAEVQHGKKEENKSEVDGAVSPDKTPPSPRGQPVGKETMTIEEVSNSTPDRLFKIVFVGNSSVGKTCFLRRFSDDCYYPDTAATVGIDYCVKTVTVDHCRVALQLWDTAGQERYRSITKQFFRKADAVIVMYDVTAQTTFRSVQQWLTSVQEVAGNDIAVLLLGNKTDMETEREVPRETGKRLAKDNNLIFYECSASSGHNVKESMLHLARILKEQEDKEKEKTVQLVQDSAKKKSCC
ncbi:EF-hand calcium-binding domain-containing protein 4B [Protopterus annectens]|uniref:EF-hand calcium-binding domain-containing protein 4B n=1 Tax=Protopterus annectens TaxID=7888 RepID=UPI001CFB6E34|nr:EF-hand calcium-binding domain-containing protein 4B [Protopterus annectens]XP_043943507.1 EF-hand calcium-binding domain-containing protein 4B [Protopterus annectens]XP_043943508.1 EF-hand calcium-binding domain-containing protein 4B [Protopterus annectens]